MAATQHAARSCQIKVADPSTPAAKKLASCCSRADRDVCVHRSARWPSFVRAPRLTREVYKLNHGAAASPGPDRPRPPIRWGPAAWTNKIKFPAGGHVHLRR
ncbi:hypothetical protein PVAP13_8NG221901 [Panicum virgatum]|uniref:Uncharacterized protein n=1 Tax=Panicum virgatum TaxID=38727 RepID=A0A8T0PEX8_PANVG|nr:hypothetical protein PVAP13_8NG221901 [Panicum virgatum]KAG2557766.1 hypothetical protein PVAP13_8NG221901 [Panicum virgatum]